MNPTEYIGALISVDMKNGDVLQGRVADIVLGKAIVLKDPFENGKKSKEPTIEIDSLDIESLKIVENAQQPPKKEKKSKKSKDKSSVAALIQNKPESQKQAKVTILKRGAAKQNDYGLSAEMSASCVVSEVVQAVEPKKGPVIPVEMIPASVLNGKKSNKSVLTKLFLNKNETQTTSDRHFETIMQKVSTSSLESKVTSDANKSSGSENAADQTEAAKNIINQLMIAHAKPSTDKEVFRKFGDFKQFTEKQKPEFSKSASERNNNKKNKGPSGNPARDQENGYKSRGRNRDLADSINLDDLNEDFDFTKNLALFDKDRESKADDYEDPTVERPASRRNYRHDENIIEDPTRCTSWVPKHQKNKPTMVVQPETLPHSIGGKSPFSSRFHPKSTVESENGAVLPVLSREEKRGYLSSAQKLFNDVIYNLTLADRFTEYGMDVMHRFDVNTKKVIVIAGKAADVVMLHRICQHLLNRNMKVVIYQPPDIPGDILSKVTVAHDPLQLPTQAQLVYVLEPRVFHEDREVRRWIMTVGHSEGASRAARIVALDLRIFGLKYMHTMMVGVADESIYQSPNRARHSSNELKLFECCVADLGTPYEWIQDPRIRPQDAFKRVTLLVY
ncbi:unnamed protein product [Bursaphelenchus okinawaensis]|uniref:DFDF domain-containing protein n=1 Tax=Bursaphelenchus okinawaensis TaxID=465554 RepID=A0A811JVD0_9BILA|nr:unnamed protein product [Bursaphelenchus okinawaensis]CAG9085594.1 unnamed protein product [Bursaphelenchus okinawaensis]